MTWFKVDDGFYSSPGVLSLRTLKGWKGAVALWSLAGSWSSDHLTDGHIPKATVMYLGCTNTDAELLVSAGLWTAAPGGYQFVDWTETNPSRADVEAKREKTRNKVSAWRRNQVTKGVTAEECNPACNPAPVPTCPVPSRPDLSRPDQLGEKSTPVVVLPVEPSAATGKRRKPAALVKSPPPTADLWEAYSEAYQARYDVPPVRNATVNGQLARVLGRLGGEEAPQVARWYLRSQNARYVASGHAVGLLLQDAEKLRTEWASGRQVTSYAAHQADKMAGLGEAHRRAMAELRAEDEAAGRIAR